MTVVPTSRGATMTTFLRQHAARAAGPDDRVAMSRSLSSAFADDPVFAWCFPDCRSRLDLLPDFFAAFVGVFARHGQSHVVDVAGAVSGVALWAPPGAAPVHPDDADAFDAEVAAICGASLERVATCSSLFEDAHPHGAAWYLQFLGVRAGLQGRGLGSVLLQHVLDRADHAGEAAFLVATSPRNKVLYERHGFRTTTAIALPDGPPAFAMWRDPR
jgi:GNAT superfamily N-acetyltransferase